MLFSFSNTWQLHFYFIDQCFNHVPKAETNIENFEKGILELRPGCNQLQSLEEVLNGILGKLRESAGQEAMKQLPWSNGKLFTLVSFL